MKAKKSIRQRLNAAKKLLKNAMAGYDMEELMSVKNSYQGNRFQWVKCSDKTRLGTVVTVSDVVPATNGMFIALSLIHI